MQPVYLTDCHVLLSSLDLNDQCDGIKEAAGDYTSGRETLLLLLLEVNEGTAEVDTLAHEYENG